ncbi:hypothetical protein SBA6_170006 [Candidatus Sulfopaludibacter sp. SbA6]|nr:hypothetical protein SBA6_170006 [Candidatus Sulfopaludibacter sp. SbA6]
MGELACWVRRPFRRLREPVERRTRGVSVVPSPNGVAAWVIYVSAGLKGTILFGLDVVASAGIDLEAHDSDPVQRLM